MPVLWKQSNIQQLIASELIAFQYPQQYDCYMLQEINTQPERSYRLFTYAVCLLTIGIAGYFAVAGIIAPASVVPGGDVHAAVIYSGYVSVRSFVLLGALAWFLLRQSWQVLGAVMLLNGLVQIGDAVMGIIQGDFLKTAGPIFLATLLVAASMLIRPNRRRISS